MSRWEILPPSESHRNKIVSRHSVAPEVNTTANNATSHSRNEEIIMQIGEFLHEEPADNNIKSCYYRNLLNAESPITLVCEWGCCPTRCCPFVQNSQRWIIDYSWALLLLAVFIACVLISSLIMVSLHYYNKRRHKHIHEFKSNSTDYSGGSDCGASSGIEFSSAYSQSTAASRAVPQIYYCNTMLEQENLPSFYPTMQTFKSIL